jgi:hypothetical protein
MATKKDSDKILLHGDGSAGTSRVLAGRFPLLAECLGVEGVAKGCLGRAWPDQGDIRRFDVEWLQAGAVTSKNDGTVTTYRVDGHGCYFADSVDVHGHNMKYYVEIDSDGRIEVHHDREKFLAYLHGFTSLAEYFKARDEAEAAALKEIEKFEANAGLTPLRGSEAQVNYARSVRMEKAKQLKKLVDPLVQMRSDAADRARVNCLLLLSEDSAAWWLDRRDKSVREILKEVWC